MADLCGHRLRAAWLCGLIVITALATYAGTALAEQTNDTIRGQFRKRAIQRTHLFGQVTGVAPAVVVDKADPDKQGRVKVKFPWLKEDQNTAWAKVVNPLTSTGSSTLPEVGDEVVCGFEHGDVQRPYVLGSLSRAADRPLCEPGKEGCKETDHSGQ